MNASCGAFYNDVEDGSNSTQINFKVLKSYYSDESYWAVLMVVAMVLFNLLYKVVTIFLYALAKILKWNHSDKWKLLISSLLLCG